MVDILSKSPGALSFEFNGQRITDSFFSAGVG